MEIVREVNKHFKEFLLDNSQHIYFLLGGYGSSKSYNAAVKLVLLSLQEKRKILVVRQIRENLKESCYADIQDIIYSFGLEKYFYFTSTPMKIVCSVTGTEFIFRGLDNVKKIKSIKDIDTIWIEEADEIDYNEFGVWTYKYLSEVLKSIGKDENNLYTERIMKIKNEVNLKKGNVFSENIYLHHSVYTDNKFLPDNFIADLETETDNYLRAIKTLGRFGSAGDTLFRNLHHMEQSRIEKIIEGKWNRFAGFDFGFSNSYNAIVRMVIDEELNDLYIYEEFYDNHLLDPEMLEMEIIQKMIEEGEVVYADSQEPKSIEFFNVNGLLINSVKKTTDMSKAGVRKIQSFRNIFIDKNVCPNTYRELTEMKWFYNKDGLIAKNPKTKKPFNIDPHTFDAIKYGISEYTPYVSNKHYYKDKEVDNET